MQVQHLSYEDNPRIDLLFDATEVRSELERLPGLLHVSERAQSCALVSVGERSFGR